MDIKKLKSCIEELKEDLGNGLLATDIYAMADGQSIAGYNSNPKACALFGRVTTGLVNTLKTSGLPELNSYYILDLTEGRLVLIVPMDRFQWTITVDKENTPLGLLLHVVLPKVLDSFEEALSEE